MMVRQLSVAVRDLRQPASGHELHGEAGSDES